MINKIIIPFDKFGVLLDYIFGLCVSILVRAWDFYCMNHFYIVTINCVCVIWLGVHRYVMLIFYAFIVLVIIIHSILIGIKYIFYVYLLYWFIGNVYIPKEKERIENNHPGDEDIH